MTPIILKHSQGATLWKIIGFPFRKPPPKIGFLLLLFITVIAIRKKKKLKADRPHPRDYPHTPYWLQANRQNPRTGNDTHKRTDGRTDGRYQLHYLPRFAVDKKCANGAQLLLQITNTYSSFGMTGKMSLKIEGFSVLWFDWSVNMLPVAICWKILIASHWNLGSTVSMKLWKDIRSNC